MTLLFTLEISVSYLKPFSSYKNFNFWGLRHSHPVIFSRCNFSMFCNILNMLLASSQNNVFSCKRSFFCEKVKKKDTKSNRGRENDAVYKIGYTKFVLSLSLRRLSGLTLHLAVSFSRFQNSLAVRLGSSSVSLDPIAAARSPRSRLPFRRLSGLFSLRLRAVYRRRRVRE